MKQAIILMTRVPHPGATKTRLMPDLNGFECAEIHRRFLQDYMRCFAQLEDQAHIFVAYAPEHATEAFCRSFPQEVQLFLQRGGNIGERMHHAFVTLFAQGYESVVLVGCDAPGLQPEDYRQAFAGLQEHDIVLSPTYDGGYCLIGLNRSFAPLFINDVRWGKQSVIEQTFFIANEWGRSVKLLRKQRDIDEIADLLEFYQSASKVKSDRAYRPVHTLAYIEEVLNQNESLAQSCSG